MKYYKHLFLGLILIPALGFGAYLWAERAREERLQALLKQAPRELVARMSLEEKVGQILHIGVRGDQVDATMLQQIRAYKPGGVILFAHNFSDAGGLQASKLQGLTSGLQSAALESYGLPLFISTDQEGGRVNRVGPPGVERYPAAMAIGQTGKPELAEEVGLATAYRLRKLGVNMVLAPVLDVNNNPRNPVINTRSFGSTPKVVTSMGGALARGVRLAYATPVLKHFPGHGDTDTDSHYALPVIRKTVEEMQDLELAPFRAAIEDGARVVMTAHILFEKIDPKNPATLSPKIMRELLREQMGFDGVIMTDAMEMDAIDQRYPHGTAARQAFQASVDVLLYTGSSRYVREAYFSLLKGFQSGELDVKALDAAVERQIALKLERGLFHRLQAPRTPESQELAEWVAKRERDADRAYANVLEKYQPTGLTLNQAVSREAVVALRRPYAGLPEDAREKTHLVFFTQTMRQAALAAGLPEDRLHRGVRSSDVYQVLRKRKAGEVWLVETSDYRAAAWNRLVRVLDKSPEERLQGPTIALHSGNPFLQLHVPEEGAVLLGFAPTEASLEALVHRALANRPAPAADLSFLPDERAE